ncbi:GFA family protein [Devosia nitrariae]|uniref:Aldehyde-activating protein n=1 Tax=Devosia nitrariae TaxID=2071872 RepID=A0ABQ5W506_9HYPH|nr:GFA family protein [Devosia nitrariae]GLQ55160.1 aldehyde-activating protein [Devosia nitrariae]
MTDVHLTGGCQCGAVRYTFEGTPELVAICHCRMCQKATGSIAWAFFTAQRAALCWTRGQPAHYPSSAAAVRGYCAACGTPLTFEPEGEDTIDVGIATLDVPAALKPTEQYWVGTRMPWFGELADLPTAGLGDKLPADEVTRRRPFQHPDHDTDAWPPQDRVRQ